MDSKFLFPYRFKRIGTIMLFPSLALGILWCFGLRLDIQAPVFSVFGDGNEILTVIHKNIYNEIVAVLLLVSLIIVGFSKEKLEDEYILKIRLDSLVWAIYINYIMLFLTIIFIFKDSFTKILIYNMFTMFVFFIILCICLLFQIRRMLINEQ